jgi:hypothetical protein
MACEKQGCRSDRSISGAALQRCYSEFGLVPNVFFWQILLQKSFRRDEIFGAADAFYDLRVRDPYRFHPNRSGTSLVALKSEAAAEKSED